MKHYFKLCFYLEVVVHYWAHIFLGVWVRGGGGQGGKLGVLLVAGVQIGGVITYYAL